MMEEAGDNIQLTKSDENDNYEATSHQDIAIQEEKCNVCEMNNSIEKIEETSDDIVMQSTGEDANNCGSQASCDVGGADEKKVNDPVINEAKLDDRKKTSSAVTKTAKIKMSKNLKKRKYRLRSSKGDDSDEEDSIMETETSVDTNTTSNDNSVITRSKSSKNTKIQKTSSSKNYSASSKRESTSNAINESGQISSQGIEQPSKEASASLKSDSDSSTNSDRSSSSISSCTGSSDSSLSLDSHESEDYCKKELSDDEEWMSRHTDPVKPPTWIAVKELYKREYGYGDLHWQHKLRGSRHLVSRLEKQYTLHAHEGCVNALHFNQTGTLLASGSDDLNINIWEFESSDKKPSISYNSGHRSNVFQSKFMPNSNDLTVMTCGRDGQVRMGCLSSTGTCRDTQKLAQHRGSAHKLCFDRSGSNSIFFSSGEDGVVMEYDLRDNNRSKKLVTVKEGSSKIALYAIDTSPRQPFEIAAGGRDEWARVYDRRMLSSEASEPVAKYCPSHLQTVSRNKAHITCLVYNHDGRELLCSYNDEDIYLFDATHSSMDEFKRKYKGHRNNATVKGVNYYGPNSEFIVSGSDCGNIFLWDKASSQVVRFMQGDEGGVVNVLEPHPNLPILATSGLDNNIKIWGPTGDGELDQKKLKTLMLANRKERFDDGNEANIDSQMLWFLMRSLRSRRRDNDGDGSSDNGSSGSSDSEGGGRRDRVDCMPS